MSSQLFLAISYTGWWSSGLKRKRVSALYVIRQLNTQNRFVEKRCHIGFYKTVQKGCTDIKQNEGNLGLFVRIGKETPAGNPEKHQHVFLPEDSGFSFDFADDGRQAVHSGGLQ